MAGSVDPALAEADRARLMDRLQALVRVPSVGVDPARAGDMEEARRLIEGWIAEAGFTGQRRLDGGGQPALYAERLDAPGAPTLLVYAHYDVQPPEPLAGWTSPPFAPEIRDDRLYGRGASDDKGPMLVALEALAALIRAEGRLPVNVRLLIEGEEETGSPSLPGILAANADLLAADAVLSADGARWRPDLLSVNVATRGTAGLEFRLSTAAKDLHSGRYGGIVPNALHAMARVLASLHDADGRVAVPGFYEGVTDPSEAERAEIAAIPFEEGDFLRPTGAPAHGEAGFSTLERLWLRPCLDVNGMWGGHTGAGSKTVIAHEAFAKLTVRLVAGQDPARVMAAIEAHLRAAAAEICPGGARIEITGTKGMSAAHAVPPGHPLLEAAEGALSDVFGAPPHRVRIGASIPLTGMVAESLGIDTVMFSFATADENIHAPDEFFRLSAIEEGLAAWIAVLRRAGGQAASDYAGFRRGA